MHKRPRAIHVAAGIAAIVAAVFVWWAWKQGAYFGNVFFPGAITLYGLLILLLMAAPFYGRLAGSVRLALAAIVALAGWTLLSIAWTSTQDAAVQDAERALLYAAVFALGLWSCNLAGRRMLLPLATVAVTGAVIGILTTITLASGTDVASYVHMDDATLRFPIGYRNAEAAFLLICLWPMITLAAEGKLPWQLRALIIGAATMLLDLAVLAESRGSLPALVVALAVFLALSPHRLRAATYLALAAVPVLPALPALLDVFQYGHGGPGLIPLLRDAARATALSALGSIALAAICIRGIEFRLALGRRTVQRISWAVAATAVAVVAVGGTVFVGERGGPIKFVDQRVSEFNRVGNPNLQSQGARFGVNIGSNRRDFWRVASDEGGDHPLLGGGAGSFANVYLLKRDSGESPNDPHSVEMLMLSELGVVGLLLFGTFVVGAAASALRSRRLGPSAAALVAASLGAGAYWLAHASYDWFWHYPAVTAPAIFLLGAAAAPTPFESAASRAGRIRWTVAAVCAVALLAAVPLFLSQRYAHRAYGEWRGNPDAAFTDLDRAASLDPFDAEPLLAKGVIALRVGRPQDAVSAFRDAVDREPDGYAPHLFLARALESTEPAAARAQADEALRLNPLDPGARSLDRKLKPRPRR
jgi:O-Antigen ligase/Tetratricopeptide repeat